jgi:hypothetical protein
LLIFSAAFAAGGMRPGSRARKQACFYFFFYRPLLLFFYLIEGRLLRQAV